MEKSQKQMMDIDKKTAMTPSLSNEHQRNWDDDLMTRKVNNPIHNYDPSRMHLNFQITKGGRITPIDTSKNIVTSNFVSANFRKITCSSFRKS